MTELTRRAAMAQAAGGAVALSLAPLKSNAYGAPTAAARQGGFFRYAVGDVRCTALYDGIWEKPHDEAFIGNASVADTRTALAAGGLPAGHVTIEFTQTVIETGGRTIIIDPGTGGQWVPTAGRMPQSLTNAGIAQQAVDTVLISHFHPDHIFGLMAPGTDAPMFPDAEIIVPADEYAFWTDGAVFSALPKEWHGLAARIQRTFPRWPNVRPVDDMVEVAPGVRSLAAPGHTVGHTAYHVASGDDELIVAGDVALTPALFVAHPDWRVAFDALPEVAVRTRRRLLDRVATDRIAIAGYHFGFPNVGHVARDGAGFAFTPM